MCNLRAQRHSCGHVVSRPVSTCRFTYQSPNSTERPLCHPSPELTVNIPASCRQCQYNIFCQRWESRLSEARAKQTAARMLLKEVLEEEDDWAAGEWGNDDNEEAIEEPRHGGQADWGMDSLAQNDDTFGWGGFDGNGYSDTTTARRERERADREVDSLWTQYQYEQWTAWRYFVTGPSVDSESSHRRSLRRRRTQCRLAGRSSLSSVTSINDLPDPVPAVPMADDDDWNGQNDAPSPSSETSNESEGSDQGGVSSHTSARTIRSDVTADWKTWSWPKAGGGSPLSVGLDHISMDTSGSSGRMSPPSPTTTSPSNSSPRSSTGSSPSSLSSVSSWDDDDDNTVQYSVQGKYKPRDDSGIAMMELGAMEAKSVPQDDDWLPAWGA